MRLLMLIMAISLSACTHKPTLPNPSITYPAPPAELMTPPRELEKIPLVSQ